MNSVGSTNLIAKYQMFKPSGFKDIGIKKCEFVAKTQFLSILITMAIVFLGKPKMLKVFNCLQQSMQNEHIVVINK